LGIGYSKERRGLRQEICGKLTGEADEDDRHPWQQRIHAIPILLIEFYEEEEIPGYAPEIFKA